MPGQSVNDQLRLLSKLPEGHVLLQLLEHYRQAANAMLRTNRGDDLIVAQGYAKAIDQLQEDIRRGGQAAKPIGPSRAQVEAARETARSM